MLPVFSRSELWTATRRTLWISWGRTECNDTVASRTQRGPPGHPSERAGYAALRLRRRGAHARWPAAVALIRTTAAEERARHNLSLRRDDCPLLVPRLHSALGPGRIRSVCGQVAFLVPPPVILPPDCRRLTEARLPLDRHSAAERALAALREGAPPYFSNSQRLPSYLSSLTFLPLGVERRRQRPLARSRWNSKFNVRHRFEEAAAARRFARRPPGRPVRSLGHRSGAWCWGRRGRGGSGRS